MWEALESGIRSHISTVQMGLDTGVLSQAACSIVDDDGSEDCDGATLGSF
jgi:hypothetical protein